MNRWRLDEGLFLEDSGTLLPWLAPWNTLPNLGAPEVKAHETSITYRWKTRILSGLAVDVQADLTMTQREAGGPYQDHFCNAVILVTEEFTFDRDARETYLYLKDRIASVLGSGRETDVDGRPGTRWRVGAGRISAQVCDRMGEYVTIAVWHSSLDVFWP